MITVKAFMGRVVEPISLLFIAVFLCMPAVSFAQDTPALDAFVGRVVELIIQPLIMLLFASAMFFFVVGGIGIIVKADDPKERQKARRLLIWGIGGFFIMTSAVAILAVVTNTFCGVPFCRI